MPSFPQADSPAIAKGDSLTEAVAELRKRPRELWLDLARCDQSQRWRKGTGIPAERYFALLPELLEDDEDALVLICAEAQLRRESRERPTVAEFQKRFPQLADGIALQFEVDRALSATDATAPTEAPNGLGGAALPGYEFLECLGSGSSGTVYKALQHSLKRFVAIKVCAIQSADEKRVARQYQEAEILARLAHPQVVQVHEVVRRDGRLFLVMEYVEGSDLKEILAGKPLTAREAAHFVRTLSRAIHEVHEAGVLHRDLKPSNVLVARDGTLRVSDFGLAKLRSNNSQLTTENTVLGTPSYMAPEQASGCGDIGLEADVYSLGAILYEFLTGRPPFLGATILDTLSSLRQYDPPAPRQLQPSVPRDLETICLTCLAKAPSLRYRTAAALAEDLGRFLKGEPIRARRPSSLERVWRWSRRNPVVSSLAAGLIMVVIAGFASVWWQWRRAETARRAESVARGEADKRAAEIRDGGTRLQSALELVDRARTFRSWRRTDDAASCLAEAIRLRADLRTAWDERSQLYGELGLWELAVDDQRQAFKLAEPSQTADWRTFCTLLAYVGDEHAYEAWSARMRERFRGHAPPAALDVARVNCLLERGDAGQELVSPVAFDDATSLIPESIAAYVRGLASYRAGNWNDSVAYCRDSMSNSLDWPGRALNHAVLALSYSRLGESDEASAAWKVANEAAESWTRQLYESGKVRWVFHKGATAAWPVSPNDWLELQVLLREARSQFNAQSDFVDPRWTVTQARAFMSLGRYAEAEAEYGRAVADSPMEKQYSTELHRCRAYSAIQERDFASAAREFRTAWSYSPSDHVLGMYLAEAHLANADLDAYREVCRTLLERFGDTTDPYTASTVVHACTVCPDAVPDAARVLSLANLAAQAFVGAQRLQGAANVRARNFEDALRCYRQAERLHAPHPCDMCMKSIAHACLGQIDESRQCLEQARKWMEQAERLPLPSADLTIPAWGNWPWNEPLDAKRLLAEAEVLLAVVHATP